MKQNENGRLRLEFDSYFFKTNLAHLDAHDVLTIVFQDIQPSSCCRSTSNSKNKLEHLFCTLYGMRFLCQKFFVYVEFYEVMNSYE